MEENHLPQEIWKAIPGYEGYYEASNLGDIRSVDRILNCPWGKCYNAKGKKKASCSDKYGYLHVCLCKENKKSYPTIHKLVAMTFIPNPEDKPCIDHIDGDKLNNSVTNLRWCTVRENNQNPITIQRHKDIVYSDERNAKISKRLKGHKLSEETRKKISNSRKLYYKKLKSNGRKSNPSC